MKKKQIFVVILFVLAASAVDAGGIASTETDEESELRMRLSLSEMAEYDGARVLMSEDERMHYLSIENESERAAWIESFWKDRDLTITTDKNERRIEHVERVKLARELFPSEKYPGWDSRGDAFIRYGFPAARGRIWGNISQANLRMPGESWRYGSPDTVLNFIDLYLDGEFVLVKSSTDMDPWTVDQEGGLFRGSRDSDPAAAIRSVSGDGMEFSMDALEQSDLLGAMVEEVSEKYGLEGYQPTGDENSFFLFPDLDLNMISLFDILCFRAGENSIRTEVNLEVPLTELSLKDEGGLLSGEVEMRVLVFDTDKKEVAASSEKFSVVSRSDPLRSAPGSLLGQTVLTLEPALYSIWIEVVDLNGPRRSILKTKKWAYSLDGGLAISDIQYAKKVAESDQPSRYMKNNLVVIPHPLHLYKRPFPVTLYFEIYGLSTDKDDHTFYSVEYEIEPVWDDSPGASVKERPETITSSFDTGGYGSTQTARILIATEELKKGPYTLIVKVLDRRTRESVERKSRFSIME